MKYDVLVWDITFCKVDEDGNTLIGEDGKVQLFHDPKMDCSYISENTEEDDLIYYKDDR